MSVWLSAGRHAKQLLNLKLLRNALKLRLARDHCVTDGQKAEVGTVSTS